MEREEWVSLGERMEMKEDGVGFVSGESEGQTQHFDLHGPKKVATCASTTTATALRETT